MNILILSWRGPSHPHAGGAEEVTWQHAKHWTERGHCVTLFTSSFAGANQQEIVDSIKIIRMGDQAFGVKLKALWWYLFINKERFDLVIDEIHGLPFFTPLYIRTQRLAYIHEVAKEVWRLNPWPWPLNLIPSILGIIGEPWIYKTIYRNTPFMVVSKSTQDDLIDWGIKKSDIHIINNGVTIINPGKILKSKDKIVLYLGSLSKDKGIEDALLVFKNLYQKDRSLKFWIAGKGSDEYTKLLKARINQYHLSTATRMWGFVSQKKKFELLKRAAVLIHPSVREGWGLVVIEAAAMGTPTVGYNVPGLRDSIIHGKTGLLCQENSPEGMADQVSYLLNSAEYQDISNQALAWSKKFSWSSSTKQSLQLINSLVEID